MLTCRPVRHFTRITVTLWDIWTSRCKAIHEDIFESPLSTHGFIISYLKELQAIVKPSTSRANQPLVRAHAKWLAPPSDHAKINVDVASVQDWDARTSCFFFCYIDNMGVYLGASAVVF
jgi:hypothetical protein